MMKRLSGVFAVLLSVAPLWADSLPRGRWWSNPAIVERLQLTPQQQGSLDEIFQRHAPHLIDARASVEKQAIELRYALDQSGSDRQLVERIVGQLNESRGRLFQREMIVLLDARQVLSDEQWRQVRQVMEAGERRRGGAERRERAGGPRSQRPAHRRP